MRGPEELGKLYLRVLELKGEKGKERKKKGRGVPKWMKRYDQNHTEKKKKRLAWLQRVPPLFFNSFDIQGQESELKRKPREREREREANQDVDEIYPPFLPPGRRGGGRFHRFGIYLGLVRTHSLILFPPFPLTISNLKSQISLFKKPSKDRKSVV